MDAFHELRALYTQKAHEIYLEGYFQAWINSDLTPEAILASIPPDKQASYRPLHLLYLLLQNRRGPWPLTPLHLHYARLLRCLPVHLSAEEDQLYWVLKAVETYVKSGYKCLTDFLSIDDTPSLRTSDPDVSISHRELFEFVRNFSLPSSNRQDQSQSRYKGLPAAILQKKSVISLALANGPLLAATCLAVAASYVAAPMNPLGGMQQFRSEVIQSGATYIITTRELFSKLSLFDDWASINQITILLIDWEPAHGFTMWDHEGRTVLPALPGTNQPVLHVTPNKADDLALILFTSGTSGTKKCVPITLHSIISGALLVVDSWGLESEDTCINMMPLYHIGGLVRNIVAPIFAGGSVVCCQAFDASRFWDLVESGKPTWYYASPTMHHVILAAGRGREEALRRSNIRLVCNAAGDLPQSLASQLRSTFQSVVLPSYGMTECMPISTPPLDYTLERPGTSGYSCGPQLVILDQADNPVPTGTTGRICIRGEPLFRGYLQQDGSLDRSCFNSSGWFDTGDLGFLNMEQYLYVTGRTKDIINRGGELISPSEVETAILTASATEGTPVSGRIDQVLAFAIPHDVLQETVAVALVTPSGKLRIDLRALHAALKTLLHQAKWPVMICYMDQLPRNSTNKPLRSRLAKRLGMMEFHDGLPYFSRHLEALCPATDTSLLVPIPSRPLRFDKTAVNMVLSTCSMLPPRFQTRFQLSPVGEMLDLIIWPTGSARGEDAHSDALPYDTALAKQVESYLFQHLDAYLVPGRITMLRQCVPVDPAGAVDASALQQIMDLVERQATRNSSLTVMLVKEAVSQALGVSPHRILVEDNFFDLGGDSIRAGALSALLRRRFGIQVPVTAIFEHDSIKSLADWIDTLLPTTSTSGPTIGVDHEAASRDPTCQETRSSTQPMLMVLQLLPIALLYPMRRGLQWTFFLLCMTATQRWSSGATVSGRLVNLVVSIMIARVCIRIIAPLVGILAKWVIIGRYKEGLFPMWGSYHTRWWMVQKIVSICGQGVFGLNDTTHNVYLRAMGARVGRNVRFHGCQLGEWDLLDLGDGSSGNKCICRPFAVEAKTSMYLGRIEIGANASIGLTSIIAPGSAIPAGSHIGPNSSSWEAANEGSDGDDANGFECPPEPAFWMTLLLTCPLIVTGWFLELLPWLSGLVGMVIQQPNEVEDSIRHVLRWFAQPHRVGFHLLALVLRVLLSPVVGFFFAYAVRRVVDDVFRLHDFRRRPHQLVLWRNALIRALFPNDKLSSLASMFGQHYEMTSIILRSMGAKIGRRVYWPGTGPSIGDYHMLNIGNDVVFGSRAHLVTSDAMGTLPITVEDNAMIADRVVLQPGVNIGYQTVMGSGALSRRGESYVSGAVYVGSRNGQAIHLRKGGQARSRRVDRDVSQHEESLDIWAQSGNSSQSPLALPEELSDNTQLRGSLDRDNERGDGASTNDNSAKSVMSPFSRAFYQKQAPYKVLGIPEVTIISCTIIVLTAVFWNVPSVAAIQITQRFTSDGEQGVLLWEALRIWGIMTFSIAVITITQVPFALAFVILAKHLIIGHRVPGNYDWDKSSYCQRWQLHLALERLRRHCFRSQGILSYLTGTEWLVWYYRLLGSRIGRNCALFANGHPTVMLTEPDLVSIGNRVAIDDASIVAHINTRGNFDLNRLDIGDGCVLRSGSRLLSGASMQPDACLLEHTLVMGGDVVGTKCTLQGWPAESFVGRRMPSRKAC